MENQIICPLCGKTYLISYGKGDYYCPECNSEFNQYELNGCNINYDDEEF